MVAECDEYNSSAGSSDASTSTTSYSQLRPVSSLCGRDAFPATHSIKSICALTKSTTHKDAIQVIKTGIDTNVKTNRRFCNLQLPDYASNITASICELSTRNDYHDIVLLCEGRKMAAHKLLLCAASKYLKTILEGFSSENPAVVSVVGVRWEVLCLLLQYIYMGEAIVGESGLEEFVTAGEALGVTGLKDFKKTLNGSLQGDGECSSSCSTIDSHSTHGDSNSDGSVPSMAFNSLNVVALTTPKTAQRPSNSKRKMETISPVCGSEGPTTKQLKTMNSTSSGQSIVDSDEEIEVGSPLSYPVQSCPAMESQGLHNNLNNTHVDVVRECTASHASNDVSSASAPNEGAIETANIDGCATTQVLPTPNQATERVRVLQALLNDHVTDVSDAKQVFEKPEEIGVKGYKNVFGTSSKFSSGPQTSSTMVALQKLTMGIQQSVSSVSKPNVLARETSVTEENQHATAAEYGFADSRKYSENLLGFASNNYSSSNDGSYRAAAARSSLARLLNAACCYDRKCTCKNSSPKALDDETRSATADQIDIHQNHRLLSDSTHIGNVKNEHAASMIASGSGSDVSKILYNLTTKHLLKQLSSAENALSITSDDRLSGEKLHPQQVSNASLHRGYAGNDQSGIITGASICEGTDTADNNAVEAVKMKTESEAEPGARSAVQHRFATQEEIEAAVDQYHRKLAFHEPRPCPSCERMYRDAATLRTHINIMHTPGSDAFVCSCGHLFLTKYEMYHHKKNGHYVVSNAM